MILISQKYLLIPKLSSWSKDVLTFQNVFPFGKYPHFITCSHSDDIIRTCTCCEILHKLCFPFLKRPLSSIHVFKNVLKISCLRKNLLTFLHYIWKILPISQMSFFFNFFVISKANIQTSLLDHSSSCDTSPNIFPNVPYFHKTSKH